MPPRAALPAFQAVLHLLLLAWAGDGELDGASWAVWEQSKGLIQVGFTGQSIAHAPESRNAPDDKPVWQQSSILLQSKIKDKPIAASEEERADTEHHDVWRHRLLERLGRMYGRLRLAVKSVRDEGHSILMQLAARRRREASAGGSWSVALCIVLGSIAGAMILTGFCWLLYGSKGERPQSKAATPQRSGRASMDGGVTREGTGQDMTSAAPSLLTLSMPEALSEFPGALQNEVLLENPLCPALVVPEGRTSVVFMPKFLTRFFMDGSRLAVCDPGRSPILQVSFVAGSGESTSRVVLTTLANEVLAHCEDGGGQSSLSMYGQDGLFAMFKQTGPDNWEVEGCQPWTLRILRRHVPKGGDRFIVLDSPRGPPLATCEPAVEPNERAIRIGSGFDVGLMLLIMVCIDVVEISA